MHANSWAQQVYAARRVLVATAHRDGAIPGAERPGLDPLTLTWAEVIAA